jgi:hypothetical protein
LPQINKAKIEEVVDGLRFLVAPVTVRGFELRKPAKMISMAKEEMQGR